jgi:MFS family permease
MFTSDFGFATVANLFVSLGQQMLLATLPVYVITLGGSRTDAGLVTGAAAVTALLVRPFAGWATDAWRRRPVVLLGCASYSVASAIYLVATTVPMLALGRVAHGFALSNYTTAANTYISDIAPPKRRAEAIGFFAATADIAAISGPGDRLLHRHRARFINCSFWPGSGRRRCVGLCARAARVADGTPPAMDPAQGPLPSMLPMA